MDSIAEQDWTEGFKFTQLYRPSFVPVVFHDFWCQVAVVALLITCCHDNCMCVAEGLEIPFAIEQWARDCDLRGPLTY